MTKTKPEQPTPAELEVLHVLWDQPAAAAMTVREVLERLNEARAERAYTTVMTMMNVMTDKGLLKRVPQGRAFAYTAKVKREKTLGTMLGDLLGRAFAGSTRSALVAQLLDEASPSRQELDEIRQAISQYQKQQGAS